MSDIAYVETVVNSNAAEHSLDVCEAVDRARAAGHSVELSFQMTAVPRGALYATLLTARKAVK